MSRHDGLADRLMSAIESGDLDAVRDCYSPDLSLWMNMTGETVGRDEGVDVLRGFVELTDSRRYEITARTDTADGFVQEHVLHASGKNGAKCASAACLVVGVDDETDSIISIREYLDSRAMRDLFR